MLQGTDQQEPGSTEPAHCRTIKNRSAERHSAQGQGYPEIPVNPVRPDLAFCLPVQIQLNHTDYARLVYIALHGIALWIVVALVKVEAALPVVLAGCCSLRYGLIQQALLNRYRSLVCDPLGQWYLVALDQSRQWIALDQLQMPGPLLLIRLRHFGGTVYWITFQYRHKAIHWGRLRVLSRFV